MASLPVAFALSARERPWIWPRFRPAGKNRPATRLHLHQNGGLRADRCPDGHQATNDVMACKSRGQDFDWTQGMQRTVAAVVTTVAAVTIAILWFQHHNAPRARDQAISGAILRYEASGRDLTLQTDAGARHFVVQEGAPVHAGARQLTLADLISASGCRAKVWYRDGHDVWTAREIRISCRGMVARPSPGAGTPQY